MIRLDAITLRRGPDVLLEETNLTVHPGQKIGLGPMVAASPACLPRCWAGWMSIPARCRYRVTGP